MNFDDVLQPLPSIAVSCQVMRRFMTQLPYHRRDDNGRHIDRVVEEGAEISDCCQLESEAKTVIFFSSAADQGPVIVIQMRVPREFFRRRIAIITSITFDLIGSEKTDRHDSCSIKFGANERYTDLIAGFRYGLMNIAPAAARQWYRAAPVPP